MIEQLLKAINLAGYEYKPEDYLEVKMIYLFELKREINDLRDEVERLKKECKFKDYEIKKLTGKLIEQDLKAQRLDIYM